MDPQQPAQQTPSQSVSNIANAPSHSFQQPPKKNVKPFTILGKIFLFLLIGVGLLLGGFYLGEQANQAPDASLTSQTPPSPTTTTTSPLAQSDQPIVESPTPASQNTTPVKAGLGDDTTVFEPYSIDVPGGWTDARETTVAAGIDKLTLTKNGYSVTIYQAPMGGGGCVYEEDKPNEFSQLYTNYADINGKSGQYRRSWTESEGKSITYAVCQKTQDGSYSVMSTFGAISVVSPNPAATVMLTEIDGMVASLIKQ